jgi:hypothetical protein
MKAGLARVFLALFINAERLFFIKKPKLERSYESDAFSSETKRTDYVSDSRLAQIRQFITAYFTKKQERLKNSIVNISFNHQ